jgi:hypothetical protein
MSNVSDTSRFIRMLSLMSQISCLYKGDVFPSLVLLAASAQQRCQELVGPPQALPSVLTMRDHVTSEVQREAAEAYCSLMALMCNMMSTAPAGSFVQSAAVSLVMNFAGISSAVCRHTSDVPCLKQSLLLFRRLMEQVPSSPHLQASLAQVSISWSAHSTSSHTVRSCLKSLLPQFFAFRCIRLLTLQTLRFDLLVNYFNTCTAFSS